MELFGGNGLSHHQFSDLPLGAPRIGIEDQVQEIGMGIGILLKLQDSVKMRRMRLVFKLL